MKKLLTLLLSFFLIIASQASVLAQDQKTIEEMLKAIPASTGSAEPKELSEYLNDYSDKILPGVQKVDGKVLGVQSDSSWQKSLLPISLIGGAIVVTLAGFFLYKKRKLTLFKLRK